MRVLFVLFSTFSSLCAQLVPLPKFQKMNGEYATLEHPVVEANSDFQACAEAFILAGNRLAGGDSLRFQGDEAWGISFSKGELGEGLSYRIKISPSAVRVVANSGEGAAQAAATLLQLADFEKDGWVSFPEGVIEDGSDKNFRCFMVDMGRNPHSPKTLRHVVDMMWFYKGNYLQLHLSDDQIFSWPSKAFPKLQSQNAGWTWEDFMKLEAYAQARGVTIIPEMDVPGHSSILRKSYPEVFGKTTTDLATMPEAQKGVEALIAEMLSVFKSTPYFHMGGDEAYRVPQEIQRDFINRLNVFIKSQGKQTIAWEGPREGKGDNRVATDVLLMNWRSIEFPPQEMLDAGYQVVNASWDPLYIVDHYPRTMFTAVDVKRCYEWNVRRFAHINHQLEPFKSPVITKSDEGVVGFCMPWWEGREENILPLCVPRFAAVTTAAWNREGEKDFAAFQKRQESLLPRLEKLSGFTFPELPVADPETQENNLAYLAKVIPSDGASQPHFGPERLTNGIPDQFDHFLGFPTRPDPLEIMIELREPAEISRIQIFERALGKSWENYQLFVSVDGQKFIEVGKTEKGSRGENNFVNHVFGIQKVSVIKIRTLGCEDLTFPSFSRLSEVMAFAE